MGWADAYVPTISGTLPKTNIAPENGWLEYNFPFGMAMDGLFLVALY